MFYKKFEKFSSDIIKESEIEKESFVRKLAFEIAKIIKERQRKILEDYENDLKKAKDALDSKKFKELFKKKNELRKKLFQRRKEMFIEIESELEHRVKLFVNGHNYEEFLENILNSVENQTTFFQSVSEISISMAFEQIDCVKRVCESSKLLERLKIKYEPANLLGGIIIKGGDFIMDLSIDKRLELSKKKFFECEFMIID